MVHKSLSVNDYTEQIIMLFEDKNVINWYEQNDRNLSIEPFTCCHVSWYCFWVSLNTLFCLLGLYVSICNTICDLFFVLLTFHYIWLWKKEDFKHSQHWFLFNFCYLIIKRVTVKCNFAYMVEEDMFTI